jgi:hypothetical protein
MNTRYYQCTQSYLQDDFPSFKIGCVAMASDQINRRHQMQSQAGDWKTLKNIHRNKATHIIIMMEVEETK